MAACGVPLWCHSAGCGRSRAGGAGLGRRHAGGLAPQRQPQDLPNRHQHRCSRLNPPNSAGAAWLGYSVSVLRSLAVACVTSGRRRLWPVTLLTGLTRVASTYQPGCLWWWTKLPWKINHLQRCASETHYRGQGAGWHKPGPDPAGRRRVRRPAPGQLPGAPPQGRAQDPRLSHHPLG